MSERRRLYVSATTPVGISKRKTAASIACPSGSSCSGERWSSRTSSRSPDDPGRHAQDEGDAVVDLCARRVSRLLPDRDVLRALGGERRAVPVRPALAQLHPASRAIRSSSAGETERNGIESRSHSPSTSEKWWETSRCVSKSYSSTPTCVSLRSNTVERRALFGTPTSTTKQPPGSRCAAAFAKHATCAVLRRDVVDRVEDDVDERERPVDPRRRQVADRDRDLVAASSAAARPCPARGRCRATRTPRAASGTRDPAGADRELERAAARRAARGSRRPARPASPRRRRRRSAPRRRLRTSPSAAAASPKGDRDGR